jgi:hypothetical protein
LRASDLNITLRPPAVVHAPLLEGIVQYTRVNTDDLRVAVQKAIEKINEAAAILAPFLVVLSQEGRAGTPRAREGFPEAGRSLARAIVAHPAIAAAAKYDVEAVNEDLDNVAALAPLTEKIAELTQLVADSKLVWLAEAWVPSLSAYGIAKVAAKDNGALRTIIAPLAAIFAIARAKKGQPAAPTARKTPAEPAAPTNPTPAKGTEDGGK